MTAKLVYLGTKRPCHTEERGAAGCDLTSRQGSNRSSFLHPQKAVTPHARRKEGRWGGDRKVVSKDKNKDFNLSPAKFSVPLVMVLSVRMVG